MIVILNIYGYKKHIKRKKGSYTKKSRKIMKNTPTN